MCPVYAVDVAVVLLVGVGGTARFDEEKRSTVVMQSCSVFFRSYFCAVLFISLLLPTIHRFSYSASWVGLDRLSGSRAGWPEGYLNDYENVFRRLGWIGSEKADAERVHGYGLFYVL